jgi:hypothetical protein
MSTAQLIVVIYAAFAVEGVLLFRALEGSASALIMAIVVPAGVLVYFLRPHPLAKKRRVMAAVVLPIAAFLIWFYGWNYYQDWRRERAVEAETVEWAKANIPPWFQQQYRQRIPDGSWADMGREWNQLQLAKEAADREKQEQAAAEAKQKARISARLKIGDRVWVPSDSHIARAAGYYLPQKPRLYGTVIDTDFRGSNDRYAIKWDEWVPTQVTWVDRIDSLSLAGAK